MVRMKDFNEFQVFDTIYNKLEEMEEKGKIDLSILEEFNLLIKRFKELESFWIQNEKVKIEDAFLLYHCARNCRNVLVKMQKRFLEANKMRLNPKIAKEAQQIIPTLNALYDIVSLTLEKPLSTEQQMHIIQCLKEMRNIASSLSLLPTFEEETESINMTKFKKLFVELAESIQASFFEG